MARDLHETKAPIQKEDVHITNEVSDGVGGESKAQTDSKARSWSIKRLGWTKQQAVRTRRRLRSFEEDWNAPGMDAYDEDDADESTDTNAKRGSDG